MSQPLPVTKGVPQGSILGPMLFSIYINNIAQAVGCALIHLYADDTVLYSAGLSPDFVLNALQQSFLIVQQAFSALNLALNQNLPNHMTFVLKVFRTRLTVEKACWTIRKLCCRAFNTKSGEGQAEYKTVSSAYKWMTALPTA